MYVVINACHGGFGLSREAYRLVARRLRRPCFFFRSTGRSYLPDDGESSFFTAMSIKYPSSVFYRSRPDRWAALTDEEKAAENARYERFVIPSFRDDRANPILLAVVRELGSRRASGPRAKLRIVRIPRDVRWQIGEYDGSEWVEEVHRTWR